MAPRSESPEHRMDGQAGVSLVEIVVAMFLLAVMSVAILPLMFGAVQASATNRDLVAANSFASAQLNALQATFPNSRANSCLEVTSAAANRLSDPSRSGVTASITVGPCPTTFPATVTVTVQAVRPNSTKAVITLVTAILVSS